MVIMEGVVYQSYEQAHRKGEIPGGSMIVVSEPGFSCNGFVVDSRGALSSAFVLEFIDPRDFIKDREWALIRKGVEHRVL